MWLATANQRLALKTDAIGAIVSITDLRWADDLKEVDQAIGVLQKYDDTLINIALNKSLFSEEQQNLIKEAISEVKQRNLVTDGYKKQVVQAAVLKGAKEDLLEETIEATLQQSAENNEIIFGTQKLKVYNRELLKTALIKDKIDKDGNVIQGLSAEEADRILDEVLGKKTIDKFDDAADAVDIFSLSIKNAINNIKTFVTVHTALAGVLGAVAIAFAAYKIYQERLEKIAERAEETAEAYGDLKSEVESLTSELETCRERMEELSKIDSPTIAEQEELDKLKQQNAELERKIKYKEQLRDLAQIEAEEAAIENISAQRFERTEWKWEATGSDGGVLVTEKYSADEYFEAELNGYKQKAQELSVLNDRVSQLSGQFEIAKSQLQTAQDKVNALTAKNWRTPEGLAIQNEYLEAQENYNSLKNILDQATSAAETAEGDLGTYSKRMRSYITDMEKLMAVFGDDPVTEEAIEMLRQFKYQLVAFDAVVNGTNITDLDFSVFRDEFGEAMDLLASDDWARHVQDDRGSLRKFIDLLVELGIIAEPTYEKIERVAAAIRGVGEAAEKAASSLPELKSYSEIYASVKDGIDLLAKAYQSLAEGQTLSAEEVASLLDTYPDLLAYYDTETGQIKLTTELLKEKVDAHLASQKASLESSREIIKGLLEEAEAAYAAAKAMYTLNMSRQEMLRYVSGKGMNDGSGGSTGGLSTDYVYSQYQAYESMAEAEANIQIYQSRLSEIDKQMAYLNNLGKSVFNGVSSSASSSASEAEDTFEKLKEQLEDWFSDMEFKVEILFNAGDIDGTTKLYQQMIDKAREALNNAYSMGLTMDDDWVQTLIGKVNEYKKALADLRIEEYDKLLEYNDQFDVWNEVDYSKLDTLKRKLSEINKLYEEGLVTYREYYDLYMDTAGDVYDIQREALDTLLEEVENALKQQAEDEIDRIEDVAEAQTEALEDQRDLYGELIDRKKKLLEDAKDEADYEEKVAELVKEIAKLEERISQLRLDDSREAAAERAELEEELYLKSKELADYQSDYSTDKTLESLDEQLSAKEKEIDDEIDAIEDAADKQTQIIKDQIGNEVALRQQAIALINRDYQNMMNDVRGYFESLGYVIDDSLLEPLRQGLELVAQYGSYGGAGSGITNDAGSGLLGAKSISDYVAEMKANAAEWNELDPAADAGDVEAKKKQAELVKDNDEIAEKLRDQFGLDVWRKSDTGVWYVRIGGKDVELFKQYSYHTGGVAGDKPTSKSDEIFALLKKGEVVLTGDQQSTLLGIMKRATEWMDAMMTSSFGSIANRMKNISFPISGTGIGSFSPTVEINFNGVQDLDEAQAKKYGKTAAKSALDELWEAMRKKGIT